jgi:hypothetical protein
VELEEGFSLIVGDGILTHARTQAYTAPEVPKVSFPVAV